MTHLASKQAKQLFTSFALAVLATAPAWAATKTVTLSVPGMTCAACPFTVKKALTRVDGVEKVETNLEEKAAVVSFDDSKTTIGMLINATGNAGYPSTVKS